MVIGGYPRPSHAKSELLDISGQNLSCPDINDFPIDYGSVGVFINNKALVCGGGNDGNFVTDCYSYDMQVQVYDWDLFSFFGVGKLNELWIFY